MSDPVDFALGWATQMQIAIPFLCAANDKRAGGDWETGVLGYEERLCRRSTLAYNLVTDGSPTPSTGHYPILTYGAIVSNDVGEYFCSKGVQIGSFIIAD